MDKISRQNLHEYYQNIGNDSAYKLVPNENPDVAMDICERHYPITYVKIKLMPEEWPDRGGIDMREPLGNMPPSARGEGQTIVSARKASNYHLFLIRNI